MKVLSYFKLDFLVVRETIKYILLVPLLFIIAAILDKSILELSFIFFFLIIAAAAPFSTESNEKCQRLYFSLPSKISTMVLGRFLYLTSVISLVWIIGGAVVWYISSTGKGSPLEGAIILFSGFAATIVCFIQYPIYYKFGMEKGKVLSILVYMIPAFIVFALPSMLKKGKFVNTEFFKTIIDFFVNNRVLLATLAISIVIITAMASYLISCYICEKKEI